MSLSLSLSLCYIRLTDMTRFILLYSLDMLYLPFESQIKKKRPDHIISVWDSLCICMCMCVCVWYGLKKKRVIWILANWFTDRKTKRLQREEELGSGTFRVVSFGIQSGPRSTKLIVDSAIHLTVPTSFIIINFGWRQREPQSRTSEFSWFKL